MQTEPEYWTEQHTAQWLGLAVITLKARRQRGQAFLPAYRFGKRVMYRASEVRAWADAQRIAPVQP